MELRQEVAAQVRAHSAARQEPLDLIAGLIVAHRSSSRRSNDWPSR